MKSIHKCFFINKHLHIIIAVGTAKWHLIILKIVSRFKKNLMEREMLLPSINKNLISDSKPTSFNDETLETFS